MSVEPAPIFRALDQRRAFEQILVQIEEAIQAGALRPGDRLPAERDLASTFGVSRASVREALRVLEQFGVVTAHTGQGPNSGSVIASSASTGMISALRLHAAIMQIQTGDIVDVRVVLEMHAVRLATSAATADQITDLHAVLDSMSAASTPEEFHRQDTEFHVALARASGSELLPVMMESLRGAMQRDMLAGYAAQGDWTPLRMRLLEQHRRILEFVAAGDPDGAADAIKRHIEHFYHQVVAPSTRTQANQHGRLPQAATSRPWQHSRRTS